MDNTLNAACAWFKLTEGKSCQGNPFAVFNQAFMAPGAYHIMWCLTQPLLWLSQSLGQGMPFITIPGNRPTPAWWYLPAPGIFWFPIKWLTDSFFWAPKVPVWPYSSMIRIYLVPTITLWMGIAICLGPQKPANALPKPIRDIAWNCIVMAIPPKTRCKDEGNLGGQSDQQLPSFRVDDPRWSCSTPTHKGNTIVFQPETSTTTTEPTTSSPFIIGMNSQPGIQPDRGGNNFFGLIELDQKPIKVKDVPITNQPWAATSLNTTFDFGWGEKFELKAERKWRSNNSEAYPKDS